MAIELDVEGMQQKVLELLEADGFVKADTVTFEVQDDGQCLMIYIPVDTLPEAAPSTFLRIGQKLDKIIPGRHGDYSWFATFTRAGEIVDSYFGGNLDSPESGL
jgi:hypothetical protein